MEHNMDTITHTTQPLDIRTLLLLTVEHDMPRDQVLDLIATEVGVAPNTLKEKLLVTPVTEIHKTRQYVKWTPEALEELVQRWNAGEKPGKIAQAMGCTTQTVYQKISRLRKERTDIKARESRNPQFAKAV